MASVLTDCACCAMSRYKGDALRWFDIAGRLAYIVRFEGVNISILHMGSCSPSQVMEGDVAQRLCTACCLVLQLIWGTSHPHCLGTASCLVLQLIWGTSHPQRLCTASCLVLQLIWGTSHPQGLCTASCLVLQLIWGHRTHSVSALLLVWFCS